MSGARPVAPKGLRSRVEKKRAGPVLMQDWAPGETQVRSSTDW